MCDVCNCVLKVDFPGIRALNYDSLLGQQCVYTIYTINSSCDLRDIEAKRINEYRQMSKGNYFHFDLSCFKASLFYISKYHLFNSVHRLKLQMKMAGLAFPIVIMVFLR